MLESPEDDILGYLPSCETTVSKESKIWGGKMDVYLDE